MAWRYHKRRRFSNPRVNRFKARNEARVETVRRRVKRAAPSAAKAGGLGEKIRRFIAPNPSERRAERANKISRIKDEIQMDKLLAKREKARFGREKFRAKTAEVKRRSSPPPIFGFSDASPREREAVGRRKRRRRVVYDDEEPRRDPMSAIFG